jgi:hypothetical protein
MMIEVNPEQATLDIPSNDDQVVFGENKAPPATWPVHVLLSVPLEPDEIERIGAREGWRAKTFGRGMQGVETVRSRYRILARKPPNERGRLARDGSGIPRLSKKRAALGDERRRILAADARHPRRAAGRRLSGRV